MGGNTSEKETEKHNGTVKREEVRESCLKKNHSFIINQGQPIIQLI